MAPQSQRGTRSWHLNRSVGHVHTAISSRQLLMFMADQLPYQTR